MLDVWVDSTYCPTNSWPDGEDLKEKLWAMKEHLKKTAALFTDLV
jgi:hypothetical protein